jgi:hypothetical protein
VQALLRVAAGSSRCAIPDRAAVIFSAYCKGIRVDFQPPACVIAAKSMSISLRSCAAPKNSMSRTSSATSSPRRTSVS